MYSVHRFIFAFHRASVAPTVQGRCEHSVHRHGMPRSIRARGPHFSKRGALASPRSRNPVQHCTLNYTEAVGPTELWNSLPGADQSICSEAVLSERGCPLQGAVRATDLYVALCFQQEGYVGPGPE